MSIFPKVITSKLVLIVSLFFAVLLALTSGTARYVPYQKQNNYALYQEGMSLSPAPVNNNSSGGDSNVISSATSSAISVPSFNGVYLPPGASPMIDPMGSVKASKSEECMKDNNLSTSTGFLCLSNEQKQSLYSRGGNA